MNEHESQIHKAAGSSGRRKSSTAQIQPREQIGRPEAQHRDSVVPSAGGKDSQIFVNRNVHQYGGPPEQSTFPPSSRSSALSATPEAQHDQPKHSFGSHQIKTHHFDSSPCLQAPSQTLLIGNNFERTLSDEWAVVPRDMSIHSVCHLLRYGYFRN